ncbi:MAG: hypothetical protein IJJ33_10190, partial [Victivallales bacterium]|nr:hypothetical protein [Victivallales bacterium]
MRTFVALSILCCAVALAATDTSLTPVAREDILFLAHFDESLLPEIGNSEGAILPTKITIGGQGFPLGDGRQEAVDLKGIGKCLTFGAEDNYNAREGTIQMWILPKWDLDSYAHCIFFQLVP